MNTQSRTFSKILGTHTSAIELFLLKRRIMGPGWLDVRGALPRKSSTPVSFYQQIQLKRCACDQMRPHDMAFVYLPECPILPSGSSLQVSWCPLEVIVKDPKQINPFADSDPLAPQEIPPLRILSLSIRDIMNHELNKREIVCATARTWHESELDLDKKVFIFYATFLDPSYGHE